MASRTNKQYWIERAQRREEQAFARGEALTVKMFQEYETAAREIHSEVAEFYVRYADRYGLTYEQAVRTLSLQEMQEWRGSLGDHMAELARTTDPNLRAALEAQLDALSFNSQITRLEALEANVDAILNRLYDQGVQQMREAFGDGFTQSYYHKMFDLQARAGYMQSFAKVNPRMLENVISYPWSGAMFSDRLWQNKQALLFNLRQITTQGLIRGQNIAAMSKDMAQRMGQSYRVAERLVRTETSHFHNMAEVEAYRAAGVGSFEIIATLDEATCETCGGRDGVAVPLDDIQPGVNFPPLHPNCRCSTIEHDPLEDLDYFNSGVPMPARMTYKAWAAAQGIAA